MLTKQPSNALQEFIAHRDKVSYFIWKQLVEQGKDKIEASLYVECIKMWRPKDVENLYKCLTSSLQSIVITSIIMHDFNGLRRSDPHFLPKSTQFEEE